MIPEYRCMRRGESAILAEVLLLTGMSHHMGRQRVFPFKPEFRNTTRKENNRVSLCTMYVCMCLEGMKPNKGEKLAETHPLLQTLHWNGVSCECLGMCMSKPFLVENLDSHWGQK